MVNERRHNFLCVLFAVAAYGLSAAPLIWNRLVTWQSNQSFMTTQAFTFVMPVIIAFAAGYLFHRHFRSRATRAIWPIAAAGLSLFALAAITVAAAATIVLIAALDNTALGTKDILRVALEFPAMLSLERFGLAYNVSQAGLLLMLIAYTLFSGRLGLRRQS